MLTSVLTFSVDGAEFILFSVVQSFLFVELIESFLGSFWRNCLFAFQLFSPHFLFSLKKPRNAFARLMKRTFQPKVGKTKTKNPIWIHTFKTFLVSFKLFRIFGASINSCKQWKWSLSFGGNFFHQLILLLCLQNIHFVSSECRLKVFTKWMEEYKLSLPPPHANKLIY